jgi:hypothetical protein
VIVFDDHDERRKRRSHVVRRVAYD